MVRRILILAAVMACLAGFTSGTASAHTCVYTTDPHPLLAITGLGAHLYWTCGLGSGPASVTMRLYRADINGNWIQVRSCSKTVTVTGQGSTSCFFTIAPTGKLHIYDVTIVHHTTVTRRAPYSVVW